LESVELVRTEFGKRLGVVCAAAAVVTAAIVRVSREDVVFVHGSSSPLVSVHYQ
jgi:hypothetical protein